jgi:hypothetical protein
MKSRIILALMLAFGSVAMAETTCPTCIDQPYQPCTYQPCEVRQQFGYGSLGLGPFPIPIPVFGVGYRTQSGHHGGDFSLQASTIVVTTQVKASLLYHYYFKPDYCSQFYLGGGVGPSIMFGSGDHAVLLSPELVFGKQYRNESDDLRFFQAQVSFPTFALSHDHHHHHRNHHCHILKFPLVVLSYGIAF